MTGGLETPAGVGWRAVRSIAVRILIAAVTAGLLVGSAVPAGAEASRISIAAAESQDFPRRSLTLRVEPPRAIEPAGLRITEDGRPVERLTVSSGSQAEPPTVVVIDASSSMEGAAIDRAMEAARELAADRAQDQRLGVVTFNDRSTVALPLTDDADAIRETLDEPPELGRGSAVFDAVARAVRMLGGASSGSAVLLFDGSDTGSSIGAGRVARLAVGSGVQVFPVGLRSRSFRRAAFARLGGDTGPFHVDELGEVFERLAAVPAAEHLIGYRSRAKAGERVTVALRVAGAPGTVRAGYVAPSRGAAASVGGGLGAWGSTGAMFLVALVCAALVAAALVALLRPRPETVAARLRRVIAPLGGSPREPAPNEAGEDEPSSEWLGALERKLRRHERWRGFEEQVEVAGVERAAVDVAVLAAAGTAVAGTWLGSIAPALALLALALPFAVRAWIVRRLRRVREQFAEQLADNLQVVASAIRAGQSMVGALAVVVEEATDPARREFRRIVRDERLGVPLEDAVREVARRMDSVDMEQLALVAVIQRELGGNTAEVLDRVVETIRERGSLRRMMRTLTAQGRISRIIVTAVPPVLLVAITLLNPEYVEPLYATAGGQVALAVSAAMVAIGSVVINRIVDIRV